jgi:hypothetical protein
VRIVPVTRRVPDLGSCLTKMTRRPAYTPRRRMSTVPGVMDERSLGTPSLLDGFLWRYVNLILVGGAMADGDWQEREQMHATVQKSCAALRP